MSARPPASPARRPRFERKLPAARRAALIAATIECLKRYGHDGLSIRTISAQAGVSVGLINHHFPNKNELIASAYRHFNSELVAGLCAAVARAAPSPRARLRAFLDASFSAPNLDGEVLAVWVVFWGLHRHSRLIQRVQRETNAAYNRLLRDMLAELLGEAVAARRTRSRRRRRTPVAAGARLDLRLAAIGLTALVDGLWLEWCLEPSHFRPRDAVRLCEAWVEALTARGASGVE